MYHLPAMCSSMTPSLPRRGPGFQLKMLIRVCSSKRLGTQLSKRYFGWGEKCLLYRASRKMGLAHPLLANWRYNAVDGSDIAQAVYPSRMDETSSSEPEKILSSECGKSIRLGLIPKRTAWTTSSTICFDGAGSSCGSVTNGLCAASSFGCLKTNVRKNTRAI